MVYWQKKWNWSTKMIITLKPRNLERAFYKNWNQLKGKTAQLTSCPWNQNLCTFGKVFSFVLQHLVWLVPGTHAQLSQCIAWWIIKCSIKEKLLLSCLLEKNSCSISQRITCHPCCWYSIDVMLWLAPKKSSALMVLKCCYK